MRWEAAIDAVAIAAAAVLLFLWPDVLSCAAGCFR
jgi:hypothetical protein